MIRQRLLADSIISSGDSDVSDTPQQAVTRPSTPNTVVKEIDDANSSALTIVATANSSPP
ncbi:MAG: hypothetical protein ACR2HJ_02325 [Fimbriimonadales bacterium]